LLVVTYSHVVVVAQVIVRCSRRQQHPRVV